MTYGQQEYFNNSIERERTMLYLNTMHVTSSAKGNALAQYLLSESFQIYRYVWHGTSPDLWSRKTRTEAYIIYTGFAELGSWAEFALQYANNLTQEQQKNLLATQWMFVLSRLSLVLVHGSF